MTNKRKDDVSDRVYFRSERLFQQGGAWYFNTREGKVAGPFVSRGICNAHLEAYVSAARSGPPKVP